MMSGPARDARASATSMSRRYGSMRSRGRALLDATPLGLITVAALLPRTGSYASSIATRANWETRISPGPTW